MFTFRFKFILNINLFYVLIFINIFKLKGMNFNDYDYDTGSVMKIIEEEKRKEEEKKNLEIKKKREDINKQYKKLKRNFSFYNFLRCNLYKKIDLKGEQEVYLKEKVEKVYLQIELEKKLNDNLFNLKEKFYPLNNSEHLHPNGVIKWKSEECGWVSLQICLIGVLKEILLEKISIEKIDNKNIDVILEKYNKAIFDFGENIYKNSLYNEKNIQMYDIGLLINALNKISKGDNDSFIQFAALENNSLNEKLKNLNKKDILFLSIPGHFIAYFGDDNNFIESIDLSRHYKDGEYGSKGYQSGIAFRTYISNLSKFKLDGDYFEQIGGFRIGEALKKMVEDSNNPRGLSWSFLVDVKPEEIKRGPNGRIYTDTENVTVWGLI